MPACGVPILFKLPAVLLLPLPPLPLPPLLLFVVMFQLFAGVPVRLVAVLSNRNL